MNSLKSLSSRLTFVEEEKKMFNNGNQGYSLSDIAAATGNNNGWGDNFGNGGWWILLFIIALFGGWGNGNGWGNNGNNVGFQGYLTRSDIADSFDTNSIMNGINGIQTSICNNNAALLTNLNNGFNGVTNAVQSAIYSGAINTNTLATQIAGLATDQAAGFCNVKYQEAQGLAQLNYNLATEACADRQAVADAKAAIIENQNANTRSILDFLTQDKITELTAENQALRFAQSQAAQNQYLVNALNPTPAPAYVVPNPYTGNYYGYNSSCGCGCGTM